MVLEEATAPFDSFSQDAPTSDADPYALSSDSSFDTSSPSRPSATHIDWEKLPPVWGLTGPRQLSARDQGGLDEHLGTVTRIMERPLQQQEIDALSYHFVHGQQIQSYGLPLGVIGGWLYHRRTRETYAFPFWKPADPNTCGPLKGAQARFVWRAARSQVYAFVGVLFASLFFGGYSVSVAAQGRAADPRLKDFNETLRQRMRQYRGENGLPEQQQQRGQRNPITTREGGMDRQIGKAEDMTERIMKRRAEMAASGRQQQQQSSQQDEMSPTAGSWMNDSRPTSDSGLLSDEQTRQRERRQQADYETGPTENRESTFDMDKVTSQPKSFDDASPTSSPQDRKQYPAGSAWERIRREAADASQRQGQGQSQDRGAGKTAGWGGVQREQQREQQQGSTLGDSFAFSSTDEERELAKSEAQKDFDARLDRERQGGDFSENRRGRGW